MPQFFVTNFFLINFLFSFICNKISILYRAEFNKRKNLMYKKFIIKDHRKTEFNMSQIFMIVNIFIYQNFMLDSNEKILHQ